MVPILMYHQVTPEPSAVYAHYTVTPAAFARQMKVLRGLGYRAITLDELVDGQAQGTPPPSRSVVVTLDDGFADAVRYTVPVLTRYGFSATFFVVAALIGRSSEWTRRRGVEMPLADAVAIRELAASGFTIGSHTATHRRLADLREPDCREEMLGSRRRLEDLIGRAVHHLAYPYGSTSPRVREAAAECGYRAACATVPRLYGGSDDLLMLPRVQVAGRDTIADFVCRLRTAGAIRDLAQRVRATMNVSAFAR